MHIILSWRMHHRSSIIYLVGIISPTLTPERNPLSYVQISCPHSPEGVRTDISSKSALIQHIKSMNSTHFHLADMQICQMANLHTCSQCDCVIYTAQDHRTNHHDSRTTTNLDLCLKHIQGKLPPNYNPIWEKGLECIYSSIAPDPASFRVGVCGKVSARI